VVRLEGPFSVEEKDRTRVGLDHTGRGKREGGRVKARPRLAARVETVAMRESNQ
jgi:hypothetical protein